jgi:lipoprotein-releasing system permease protein
MYEYDASLVGVTIPRAQALFGLSGTVSGLAVRLDQLEQASEVKWRLASQLGDAYTVRTWMELNQTLFDALKLEKITMFVILTLIVLVAAVNIVSTLIMMVIEKTRDIGILKSIGASSRSIRWIFTWQGLVIGLVGTALGVAGAWGLVWVLDEYQFIRLPSTIYYLDHLPVRIEWADWMMTVVAALVISLLATVYPAHQAARLVPVEALRYE